MVNSHEAIFVYVNLQAWKAYSSNDLIQLVDPILDRNYPVEEAVRFLKVGLLCVQETVNLRPRMPVVVQMLTNETAIEDTQISEPGVVADFMTIRMRQNESSDPGSTSSYPTSMWGTSANLGR